MCSVACAEKDRPEPVEVTETVGAEGGEIETPGGARLSIPRGALDSDTEVTVIEEAAPAPKELGPVSSLYRFEPEGAVFAKPVRVSLPVPAGSSDVTVFWSRPDGEGFEDVGGAVAGGRIETSVIHFSSGFVAEPTGVRVVSGSRFTTWKFTGTVENVPEDLTDLEVAAVVIDETGESIYPGMGEPDGTFTIPDVPYGTYYLKIGTEYFVTSESVVDLGLVRLGRPDRIPASDPTSITFDVTNMEPWEEGDSLELFSPEADSWWFNLEAGLPVAPGATELADYTVTAAMGAGSYPEPASLIDGGQGDRTYLAQLTVRQSAEGADYQAMSRVFEPVPIVQADGQGTTETGAFSDVSADFAVSADLRVTEFEALFPDAHPSATSAFSYFAVLGQAEGLEDGPISSTADLLYMDLPSGSDISASNMTYGRPLGGSFGVHAAAAFGLHAPVQLGDATPSQELLFFYRAAAINELTSSPIVPRLSPVQNSAIEGQALAQAQSGTGTTPTLTWEAPATGTVMRYEVLVFRVFEDGGTTQTEEVASFRTGETSLALPAGILEQGSSYAVQIVATETTFPANAPYRVAFPLSLAPFQSAVFTP